MATAPKAPKVALYINDAPRIPSELFVLKENADGTVDLSRDGKEPVVTGCTVSDSPKAGQCGKPYAQKKAPAKPAAEEEAEEGDEPEGDGKTPGADPKK